MPNCSGHWVDAREVLGHGLCRRAAALGVFIMCASNDGLRECDDGTSGFDLVGSSVSHCGECAYTVARNSVCYDPKGTVCDTSAVDGTFAGATSDAVAGGGGSVALHWCSRGAFEDMATYDRMVCVKVVFVPPEETVRVRMTSSRNARLRCIGWVRVLLNRW